MSEYVDCPLCGRLGKYEDGAGISLHDGKGTLMLGKVPFSIRENGLEQSETRFA